MFNVTLLEEARAEYRAAIARRSGQSAAKERVKNLLFENLNEIIANAHAVVELNERIDALEAEIERMSEVKSKPKAKPKGDVAPDDA